MQRATPPAAESLGRGARCQAHRVGAGASNTFRRLDLVEEHPGPEVNDPDTVQHRHRHRQAEDMFA